MNIKTPIARSVGSGGSNAAADVKVVQMLLNNWLRNSGALALKVDGIAGPKTSKAITEFQKSFGGVTDGRVDPAGATIKRLLAVQAELLQKGASTAVLNEARRRLQENSVQMASLLKDVDLGKALSDYLEALKKS
jgi:peptidoglycan hydrolase-like protein with peptidoglycan-binding domain